MNIVIPSNIIDVVLKTMNNCPIPPFPTCLFYATAILLVSIFVEIQLPKATTEDLQGDISMPLPLIVRAVGLLLKILPWTPWDVSDAEALLERGAKDAGLPPKYTQEVVESIEKLCDSVKENDVQFHWVGRWNMHDTIVSGLSHYLQINKAHDLDPSLSTTKLNHPLVVVGIPRSGTTHLHRLLCAAPDTMSIPLWQHFYPAPPTSGFDCRRWSLKFQFLFFRWIANQYGIDAAHFVRPDLPDECNFSLRMAGASHLYWSTAPLYNYLEWLQNNANGNHVEESYIVYRRHLQMIQALHPEKRLVLKCPSHASHLQKLSKIIPEAKIIFTHRDPTVLAASEASLIARLQATSVASFDFERTVHMNLQKNINYGKNMVKFVSQDLAPEVFHVAYSRLVSNPNELVREIHKFFDLPSVPQENHLNDYLDQNRQHSKGKHRYPINPPGLDVEVADNGFRQYKIHFREYLSSPAKKSDPKSSKVDVNIMPRESKSDTRTLWPIFVVGYCCVFVYEACKEIIREALQGRFLNRCIDLRNARFAGSLSSTWTHCINGDYVQHRDGNWYKCFMTNGFDYLALPHVLPHHHDNRVDPGMISDFEKRFARYVGAESGIMFVTGFLANVETLRGLGKVEKTIFLWDSECHRSAIEGVQGSPNINFEHNSTESLEKLLRLHTDDYKNVWVLVEGTYSMSGDLPDYQELKRLKEKYGFKLMVDRAHSFIFDYASASHAGSSDMDAADLHLLTFAKSGGHFGGFVFGKSRFVEHIRRNASEESKSYPSTSLDLLDNVLGAFEDGTVADRTKKVKEMSYHTYDYLTASNWKVLSPRGSHIVIVQIGISDLTCALQQWCIQHGVYLAVIGHPAIASRFNLGFRICINASMTEEHLYQMVQIMNSFNPFAKNDDFAVKPTRAMSTLIQTSGLKAARNLGGTSLETKETEAAVAQAFGFDRCIYCADTTLGLKYWRKIFSKYAVPVCFTKNGLDEVTLARQEGHPVVVCPVKPFGCIMLCEAAYWRDFFYIMHPSFVFTTAIPPFVWNPLVKGNTAFLIEENRSP